MLPTAPKPAQAPSMSGTTPFRPGMPFPQQRPTTIKAQAPRPNPVAVKPPTFAQATPQGIQQAAQAAMKVGRDTAADAASTRLGVLYGLGEGEYGPDLGELFGKAGGDGEWEEGIGGGGGMNPFGGPGRLAPGPGFRWGALTKRAANGAVAAASVPPQPQPPGMMPPPGAPMMPPGVAPAPPMGGMMPPGVGPTPPQGAPPMGGMPAPGGPMGGPPMQQPPVPGRPPLPSTLAPTDAPVPNLAADLVGQGKEQRTTVGESAKMQDMGLRAKPGLAQGSPGGPLAKTAAPNVVIKTALFGQMGRRLGRVGSGYQTVQLGPDKFVPKPRPPLPTPEPLYAQIRSALRQRQQPYGPYGMRPFGGWSKLSFVVSGEESPNVIDLRGGESMRQVNAGQFESAARGAAPDAAGGFAAGGGLGKIGSDKAAMDDCYANGCRPDGRGGCTCRGECEACNPQKRAAHGGDLKGPIVASASGDSTGLSFADAGPVLHGKAAWDDVSRYFKGHKDRERQPDPFAGKHAADAPKWLKRLGLSGTSNDPTVSASSPGPVKEQAHDAREKAADESGALTTLGGAGLAASAAGGLGSATVGGLGATAKSYLSGFARKLKAADPYDPKAAGRVRAFQEAVTGAQSPAERFVNYTDHGSRLMGAPAFRGGATGRDVMEKIYNNPLLSSVAKKFVAKPESFVWSPAKAQHYGEFAKGPVRATEQLGREIYGEKGEKGLTAQAREAVRGRTAPQAERVAGKIAPRLAAQEQAVAAARGKAGGTVAKVEAALRRAGKLPEGQAVWDSPFRAKAQLHHDRVDATAGRRLETLRRRLGVAADVEGATDRRLGRGLKATGALDPTTQALRLNLQQAHGGRGVNLDTLAHGEQRNLLDRFAKTRAGGNMAELFDRKWDGHINQYRGLGDALMTPKRVIDAAGSTLEGAAGRAGRVARGAGKAGLASLALAVPSGMAFSAGRTQDAAAGEAAQQRLADRFAAAVRGKQAADLEKVANPAVVQAGQRMLPRVGQWLGGVFGRSAPAAAPAATRAAPGLGGQVMQQALPSLGGAIGGGFTADSHGQDWRLGAAVGAAAFNPRLGQMARGMGPAAMTPVHALRGGIGGNFAGSMVDHGAGAFGADTGGRFARAGTFVGGGLGLGRGLGGMMARGGGNSAVAQVGRDMAVTGAKGMGAVSNFTRGTFDPIVGGLRRGANWMTGGRHAFLRSPAARAAQAGRAAPAAPGLARRAGQVVGGAGLVGTGGGMALGALDRRVDDKANEVFGAGLGALDEYADGKFNQYAAQAPRAIVGGMVNSITNPALQALGMDPNSVHPMQRALMLGGAGLGAAGLATGSPVMGGLGALGMGAGYMANRHNPLTGQQPGQGHQFDPRNELAHQQQLQQPQSPGWL